MAPRGRGNEGSKTLLNVPFFGTDKTHIKTLARHKIHMHRHTHTHTTQTDRHTRSTNIGIYNTGSNMNSTGNITGNSVKKCCRKSSFENEIRINTIFIFQMSFGFCLSLGILLLLLLSSRIVVFVFVFLFVRQS